MFHPAYFDHNATTPVAARVLEAMLPWFTQRYGNASSRHEYGRDARRAVDEARQRVAHAVGAHPTEVIFTSGGTEAGNLFLLGAAACMKPGAAMVSAIEHPCVRESARLLARQGWQIAEAAVDAAGRVREDDFAAKLTTRPALISVMLANNETGVVQPVSALAEQAKSVAPWFHSDAVQAFGKIPVNFRQLNAAGVHALTLSAHKIGGPKGAGALIVDKRIELAPRMLGGGHERGLRSGTENVPAIVGFGVACELALADMQTRISHQMLLRQELERGLADQGAIVFGLGAERLPNTVYFSIPGIDGETLVAKLDRAGYAVASGAACSSVNPEPSHVLLAMGVAPEIARGAVRVSIGRETTAEQTAGLLLTLAETVTQLRGLTAMAA
jgi:cysteine desulfurase